MAGGATTRLPLSFGEALRYEYARTVSYPFETILTLFFNGALVIIGWWFMPPWIVDLMFSNHKPMAFAVVMAIWMYSDVPTTNQPGSDSVRFLAALDRPDVLRRMIWARKFVLWSIVSPLSAIASILLGIYHHNMTAAMFGLVWIVVAPIGVLSLAPMLGIRFPYHPMPLRERWSKRAEWKRMGVRWGILIVAPYAWVPLLGWILTLPSLLVWGAGITPALPADVSVLRFAVGVAVGVVSTQIGARFGWRWSRRLLGSRREDLRRELADPDLG